MFQKLEDFYSQDLRIDLTPAERLAALNPEHLPYCAAAERGAFIVSVLQGDVYESVYTQRMEQFFDTLAEARSLCERLQAKHPSAAYFDFVSFPESGGVAPASSNTAR